MGPRSEVSVSEPKQAVEGLQPVHGDFRAVLHVREEFEGQPVRGPAVGSGALGPPRRDHGGLNQPQLEYSPPLASQQPSEATHSLTSCLARPRVDGPNPFLV